MKNNFSWFQVIYISWGVPLGNMGHATWKQIALCVPSAGVFNSSVNELISVIPEDNMMEAARQSDWLTLIW